MSERPAVRIQPDAAASRFGPVPVRLGGATADCPQTAELQDRAVGLWQAAVERLLEAERPAAEAVTA